MESSFWVLKTHKGLDFLQLMEFSPCLVLSESSYLIYIFYCLCILKLLWHKNKMENSHLVKWDWFLLCILSVFTFYIKLQETELEHFCVENK